MCLPPQQAVRGVMVPGGGVPRVCGERVLVQAEEGRGGLPSRWAWRVRRDVVGRMPGELGAEEQCGDVCEEEV